MDYQSLKYFIKTAELSSVTKAAESFFISQQALSKCIRQLEDELGVVLFKRNHKGVELTEEGKSLVSYAMGMINQQDEFLANIKKRKETAEKIFRYAYAEGMSINFPPNSLYKFLSDFPDTKFYITCYPDDPYHRMNIVQRADIVLSTMRLDDNYYDVLCDIHMPLKIMMSMNHPLSDKKEITWIDIAKYPLILQNVENTFLNELLKKTSAHGITAQYILNPTDYEMYSELIFKGNALTFYSGNSKYLPDYIQLTDFEESEPKKSFYLSMKKGHKMNDAEKLFTQVVSSELKNF